MFGDQYTPYFLTNKKLEIISSFFGFAAVLGSFLITFFVTWGVYVSVSSTVPIIIHPLSSQQTSQLEVFVIDKEYSRSRFARMGLFCEYKISFKHPDIPKRNYLCTSESAWDQIRVDSFIHLVNGFRGRSLY